MAASFDPALLHTVADAIATEARAKNREYTEAHDGDSTNYTGLSFWTPNINIFRDPRWGRGQETYGEDPFLTGRMAVAFIQGLQGDDPKYFKAMACAKHFAVHSGPEDGAAYFRRGAAGAGFLRGLSAAVRSGGEGRPRRRGDGRLQPALWHALLRQPALAEQFAARTSGGSRAMSCRIAAPFTTFSWVTVFRRRLRRPRPAPSRPVAIFVAGCDIAR